MPDRSDQTPDTHSGPLLLGDGVRVPNDDRDALYQETVRLREEVERLRKEQADQKDGSQKKDEGKDKKEGTGDQKGAEDKKEDEPQPPLSQRVGGWVSAHPVAVVLILVALVALAIVGFILWKYLQSYEKTDDAQVDGHTSAISSRINGTVVGVYVENNQGVTAGQTLVDLDPRDYKASLAESNASYQQALANIEAQSPNIPITQTSQATSVSSAKLDVASAEASVLAAQHDYASALADLRQAEAQAENAASEERRYRALVKEEEVSREIYEQRLTTVRAQEALVTSRANAANSARRVVDQRQAAVQQARERALEAERNLPRQIAVQRATEANRRASALAAKAQTEQAKLNLEYCKIFAPVGGIIGNRTVELGMHVLAGQELLYLTQTNDLWVTANFKETQIRKMHPGQSVTIHVDTLAQDFDGYVENMPGTTGAKLSLLPPENATGNYVKVVQRLPVRIRFRAGQSNSERLRPGMSVEPKVWVQ